MDGFGCSAALPLLPSRPNIRLIQATNPDRTAGKKGGRNEGMNSLVARPSRPRGGRDARDPGTEACHPISPPLALEKVRGIFQEKGSGGRVVISRMLSGTAIPAPDL